MNILITGGAGFIGSNFTKYWADKYSDDNIVVYDKLTYAGNKENLKELFDNPKFSFVEGDIVDGELFEKTIVDHEVNTIVHFAAETHVDRSIEGPEAFVHTNIMGTFRILEVLRKHPEIRLHHISTDEVFGELPLDEPEAKFSETTPYDPRSPYSASKAASDHLVRAYVNTYKIKATISNCSNNYGPYCFPEKLIPLTITRAINDQEIPVYGDGMQVRDWIHVDDHCLGVDLILEKGKLGETYILGGHGEKPNIYIVKEILKLLEKPESLIVHVGDRKGHDKRYAMDFTKAKNELGFEPQKPLEKRLEETVQWYVDNQEWWAPLKAEGDRIAESYLKNRI
ncbi:MAG TPA: dTDP-glucose 4,6-dehydratase [Candidatus Dojkabacteria bacterium]|nr:dTDP-glucose 4,6-dehydratase [Candidatus Dojkabacteria bacterium]HRO65770.1 dTDP-glucose 4,6-dehydratase [Candidatus Dojkabacteria bacterium]HRP50952.1 dTDP-glucose 4,6-dehydratase [Candidatus Dojkabacteria bacterium]